MKKKVIAIVLLVVLVVCAGIFSLSKKSNTSNTNATSSNAKQLEFTVRSAFADVDSDMIIENKPAKDNDAKYDYIFITFTNAVVDTKKDDTSNPLNVKNYTFDNNTLPKDTVVALGDANQVVIKLPNGYLKGVNAPHSLKISKDLKDKNGQIIKNTLDIKLPFSVTVANTSDKKSNNNTADNSQKNNDKKGDNTAGNSSDKNNTANADMPKYTVKIINNIPQTTIIAITLDSTTPENYKVSVAGNALELKKNNKGEQVFVNSIAKEYSFEEVNKLIKIEKIK